MIEAIHNVLVIAALLFSRILSFISVFFSIIKKVFSKIFLFDVHILESRGMYIVEGCERPAE